MIPRSGGSKIETRRVIKMIKIELNDVQSELITKVLERYYSLQHKEIRNNLYEMNSLDPHEDIKRKHLEMFANDLYKEQETVNSIMEIVYEAKRGESK